jgi:nicotinate-nucleotide pyrophosphorylase
MMLDNYILEKRQSTVVDRSMTYEEPTLETYGSIEEKTLSEYEASYPPQEVNL